MADFTSDLLYRQIKNALGVLLPSRATIKFAGTDVDVQDVGGETVATFGLNAGVVTGTVTTTNATPANIDLVVLSDDTSVLDTVGLRVTGYIAGVGWIRRDMVIAQSGGSWLRVGGTGANAPYQDSGIVYVGAAFGTANITCTVSTADTLTVTVTGVAATTIKWQVRAWKEAVTL